MKNKLLLTLTSLAATSTACVLPLTLTSCNPAPTYDIDITTADKVGYIIDVNTPYYEYHLSFKGLKEGDTILSEIKESTAEKVKISQEWTRHVLTAEEVQQGYIMLRIVPASEDPGQPVFYDDFSIKFDFIQGTKVCYSEKIDGFSLIAGIPTTEDMFEIDTSGQTKILKGFDMTKSEEIKKCGILVIPSDIYRISDSAFSVYEKDLTEIFKSIEWLLLDGSLEDQCKLAFIGKKAFQGCPFTETLYIPSSVEIIGESAFDECNKFNNLQYLGDVQGKLRIVETKAFYQTTFGGTLSIPNTNGWHELRTEVFGIGSGSQKKATGLVISKNITKFETNCLAGFHNLTYVDLSDYTEVPTNFAAESFYSFPKEGTIYVHDQDIAKKWAEAFTTKIDGKYVFPDFANGTWTFAVK